MSLSSKSSIPRIADSEDGCLPRGFSARLRAKLTADVTARRAATGPARAHQPIRRVTLGSRRRCRALRDEGPGRRICRLTWTF